MTKKSPMSLSLDYLNKKGWTCQIVEKRLPIPGKYVTQDAFGFGDILAYHPILGIALIQTTSAANMAARRTKIQANPHSKSWVRSSGRILLHGWGDKGLREEEL